MPSVAASPTPTEGAPKRALVAGCRGGIGVACIARFRADGWQVVGVDRGASEGVDGGELPPIDITEGAGAAEAVASARDQLGGLEAIVHTIGMSGRALGDGPVTTCTDEAWSEVLRVNLTSVHTLLRAGLPALTPGTGAFVTIGSVLAHATDDGFLTAAYAASKGGLESLSRVAAREVAASGIRVNVVAAGLVATPMAARAVQRPDLQARMAELMPLTGRALEADEVASAACYLASSRAAGITGITLPVDAGWTLR